MSHDDNVVLRTAAEVLSHPLSSVPERSFVGGIEALFASPVRGERREVKALQLRVAFEDLPRRASVARESVALLKLGQQNHLAQAAESLDGRCIANLSALKRALESGRKNDLGTRLQVVRERWQACRLLLAEWCQGRVSDRVVVGDVLCSTAKSREVSTTLIGCKCRGLNLHALPASVASSRCGIEAPF